MNDSARQRAEARAAEIGVDLDTLRTEDPQRYRMLHAVTLLDAHPSLADAAAQATWQVMPDAEVYQVRQGDRTRLYVEPEPSRDALAELDTRLAHLINHASFKEAFAFYRTVNDLRGEHRELMLPLEPDAFDGTQTALVGPFETEHQAEAWAKAHVPPAMANDTVPMLQRWFCDVFSAEEEWLSNRA
jgi:hypothetical protein